MIITTKFNIGQTVYEIGVSRDLVTMPCPVCAGKASIRTTAADGSEHEVDCPQGQYKSRRQIKGEDAICYSGQVHVGQRHRRWDAPRRLTVGQVRVYAGAFPEERVMCRETGVGSGTLYPVDADEKPITYTSRGHHTGIFGTPEEAIEWADRVVKMCNALLAVELLHAEAIKLDQVWEAHTEALEIAAKAEAA